MKNISTLIGLVIIVLLVVVIIFQLRGADTGVKLAVSQGGDIVETGIPMPPSSIPTTPRGIVGTQTNFQIYTDAYNRLTAEYSPATLAELGGDLPSPDALTEQEIAELEAMSEEELEGMLQLIYELVGLSETLSEELEELEGSDSYMSSISITRTGSLAEQVVVESVQSGMVVTSGPLVVTGSAPAGWYFEGEAGLELLIPDDVGGMIQAGQSFVRGPETWMQGGAFSGQIDVPTGIADAAPSGFVRIFAGPFGEGPDATMQEVVIPVLFE